MYTRQAGELYLEGVRLSRLLQAGLPTPFYVYSLGQLVRNWEAYAQAVAGLDATVAYAVKANHNLVLLRHLHRLGAGAVVVSQTELWHALSAGFAPGRILLHGNGKSAKDIEAALAAGVLISADSPFDLRHIDEAAGALGRRARVLLRVNPDIDPAVHPYISTGLRDSKFGIPAEVLEGLRRQLLGLSHVSVHGLHCHLGSTLKSVQPFADAARLVVELAEGLRGDGHPIDTLDLGGGLGIDYGRQGEGLPTPGQLIEAIRPALRRAGVRLLLEPGRSLVGTTGALVGRVVGVKHNPGKSFLVTDASMAELIRPSLYSAYHAIELLGPPSDAAVRPYDVVGPLCESGDFLGKDRLLPTPAEGDGIIVYDTGAYGYSMASRYNLHLFCAEYLVDGESARCIRRAETYDDFARTFADQEVALP